MTKTILERCIPKAVLFPYLFWLADKTLLSNPVLTSLLYAAMSFRFRLLGNIVAAA